MRPKKRLSQVFLIAPAVARLIAEAVPLKGKRVLEVGAGRGILTRELAERAASVTAVEIDEDLISRLERALQTYKRAEIVQGDALEMPFNGYDAVYGNLPYHLSSQILFKFLDSDSPLAIFMLQKEFAERLSAKPDSRNYSRLSVMTQAAVGVERIALVPADCFEPIPRVDSAVVKLVCRKKKILDASLVTALFQHKNQTVRNALLHSERALGLPKARLAEFAASLDKRDRKVRSLALEDFAELSKAYSSFAR